MKRFVFLLTTTSILNLVVVAQSRVLIDAEKGKHKISKHIYGHFAEHLGRCIYDGIYVGEANVTIPNINGVRTDIIEALKKLKVPNLRWPGGCFADAYHWKDGIGPKKNRPEMINRWWGASVEDNSFGTHEFLGLCEQIGADPYLAGNVGSGTVQELSDWVEYTNIEANKGPLGKLRVQNSREKPWNVKYWGVGNESWGCGGNMKPEYYATQYRQYATFMADWNNNGKIFRVASGANGDDLNWTEVMMREVPLNMMEGLSLHHYAVINWSAKGSATKFDEGVYFKTMQEAWKMDAIITKHSAMMDKYDPEKKVALVVDEWGGWYDVEPGTNPGFLYQQNTMRDAMIAGLTLNIFNKHCERVRIANLAQTVNVLQAVILTEKDKMLLTPTYHVMEMYKVHQDATMLPINVNSADYILGNEKLPSVSASASRGVDGITHISLVNIDANKKQDVTISINGAKYANVSGRILSSPSLQDHNSFDIPNKIEPADFKGAVLNSGVLSVSIPPFSVIMLELN
jgi:alpha-N-arabinofuranosidase